LSGSNLTSTSPEPHFNLMQPFMELLVVATNEA